MTFLSYSKSEMSTSVASIYTKLSSLAPSYIMKTFSEGFVNVLFVAVSFVSDLIVFSFIYMSFVFPLLFCFHANHH